MSDQDEESLEGDDEDENLSFYETNSDAAYSSGYGEDPRLTKQVSG